jgi:hypothetical protein
MFACLAIAKAIALLLLNIRVAILHCLVHWFETVLQIPFAIFDLLHPNTPQRNEGFAFL